MSKHTPKKWTFDGQSVLDSQGCNACTKTNGPLIAAAPELLDALEILLTADNAICENIGRKSDQAMQRIAAIDYARTVIVKAKGQA